MPTTGNAIKFKAGLKANYIALSTKDADTLYFCTDTQQLFIGNVEYTRPVTQGAGAPTAATATDSPVNTLYYDTTNSKLYSNINGSWSLIATNYTHPTTTATSAAAVKVGNDANGHVVIGDALTKSDVGLSNVTNDKQVKAIISSTADHILAFSGTDGSTVKDTGETVAGLKSYADTAASNAASGKADSATTLAGYGITDAKIESGTITLGNSTITPLTADSTISAAKLSGAIPSDVTATTQTTGDNSTKIATTAFVKTAIDSAKASLAGAMHFIGTTTTTLTDGATTNPIVINSINVTAVSGDVVVIGSKEFVFDGSSWVELGDPSNYIPKVTGVSGQVAKFDTNGNLESTGFTLGTSVPANAEFTDTKVTNTLATTTKAYITGTTSSTTNTGTQVFDTGVYLDTTAGTLVATNFTGDLTGNADTATKATEDASGNTITTTYATKTELTNALAWGSF